MLSWAIMFLLVAIGFAFVTLLPSRLLQTNRDSKVKLDPYECGIEPQRLPCWRVGLPDAQEKGQVNGH